jgi:hypothetical protein
MGFKAEIDANAAEAAEQAANGGDGSFKPLPQGKYQATVSDFGGDGANAHKKVLNVGFRIVDESPTGRGRVFFARVPLFSRYAPNAKHPEGAVARAFWDFWEKAMGVDRAHILAGGELPENIGGRPLTITLGSPIPPDRYNPLGSNEVDYYDAPGSLEATPAGPVNVPWLDAHGNLDPTFGGGSPAAAAQAAPAASANPWQTPAAPAFPGQVVPGTQPAAQPTSPWGGQAPVAQTPVAPVAQAPVAAPQGTSPWGQQAAAPSGVVAAAQSGSSF